MNQPKVFKLFLDTHMALSHQGLSLLAQKAKVNLQTLAEGDLLLFLNKKGDKMKVLGAQGKVIGYLKLPKGQVIMREALQYIPRTFGSRGFSYDEACLHALEKKLNLTGPQTTRIALPAPGLRLDEKKKKRRIAFLEQPA